MFSFKIDKPSGYPLHYSYLVVPEIIPVDSNGKSIAVFTCTHCRKPLFASKDIFGDINNGETRSARISCEHCSCQLTIYNILPMLLNNRVTTRSSSFSLALYRSYITFLVQVYKVMDHYYQGNYELISKRMLELFRGLSWQDVLTTNFAKNAEVFDVVLKTIKAAAEVPAGESFDNIFDVSTFNKSKFIVASWLRPSNTFVFPFKNTKVLYVCLNGVALVMPFSWVEKIYRAELIAVLCNDTDTVSTTVPNVELPLKNGLISCNTCGYVEDGKKIIDKTCSLCKEPI